MAMARLAVALPCNAADNGEATFWLGVIAFGKQAVALAKHSKGDLVSVAAICNSTNGQARMAVISKAIRSLRTVYSVPERYT